MSESIGSNTLTSTESLEIDPGYDISTSFEQQIERYNLHNDEFPEEKIPEDILILKDLRGQIRQMYNDDSCINDYRIEVILNKEYDESNDCYHNMEYFRKMMNEYQRIVEKMKDLRERHFKAQLHNKVMREATYDVYNGCHGELLSTPITKIVPNSIHKYLEAQLSKLRSDPEADERNILEYRVEMNFHKNTPLFTEVLPSSFTKGEKEDFETPPFHNYLKFTFGYEFPEPHGGGDKRIFDEVGEDVEPEIVMRIFVLDTKKNRYVKLDSIPDIEFSYEDNDKFDMGTFNIITDHGPPGNPGMYPLELTVSPFSEDVETNDIVFPKIKHAWSHLKDREEKGLETKTINHDEYSLLHHLFENLPDLRTSGPSRDIAVLENPVLKVNIFNSSCMASDNFYELITKYPKWYRCMKQEIDNAFSIRVSEQNDDKIHVSNKLNKKEEELEAKEEQRTKLLKEQEFLEKKKRAIESSKNKVLKKSTPSLEKLSKIDKSLSDINYKLKMVIGEKLDANAKLQDELTEEKEKLGNRLSEIYSLLEYFEKQKNDINEWLQGNDFSDSVMDTRGHRQLKQQKLMKTKVHDSTFRGGKSLTTSRRTSRRSTSRRRTSRRRTSASRRRTLRRGASRRRTSRRSTR
jgi:hypothetical protein